MLGKLTLTDCSEKQEANTTLPTASASPSVEDLPPLGPPDFPVPNEARTKDAADAEASLRYWIDLLNRQRSKGAGGFASSAPPGTSYRLPPYSLP